MIKVEREELLAMVTEKEIHINQLMAQFNLQIGHLQGEIAMINHLIEQSEKNEALPSEDETGE